MVLESISVGEPPVAGVALVSLVLARHSQQPLVLLLADHPHDLPVRRGQGDGLGLHNLRSNV